MNNGNIVTIGIRYIHQKVETTKAKKNNNITEIAKKLFHAV